MVERTQGLPLRCVVASLAGLARLMRIGVARSAVLRAEVILTSRHRYCPGKRLMTVGADHRHVRPGERELRLLMFCECEGRRVKHGLRVARFALVAIRLRRELRSMRIAVATLAGGRRQLVFRVRSSRFVTGGALQPLVFALQFERTLLVVFDRVQRRLETLLVMARAAIAASRPSRKLTLMDVLVAIDTERVWDSLTEVAIRVALKAGNLAMLTKQRELRSIVIEPGVRLQGFPSRGHVAISTSAPERSVFKRSLMRVSVAVIATRIAKFPIVRHRLTGQGFVATRTARCCVLARERINRLVVIKKLGRFPHVLRMARSTFSAEFAFVRVLMTLCAFAAHPEEGFVFVLHSDLGRLHLNASRVVATVALERRMLAHQIKPGHLAMVESLLIKFCELKTLAVMLVVTTRAVQLITRRLIDSGMVARLGIHAASNFGMTVQALQRALADAKCVTAGTLSSPFEIRVRSRKRTRRNLRAKGPRCQEEGRHKQTNHDRTRHHEGESAARGVPISSAIISPTTRNSVYGLFMSLTLFWNR